MSNTAAPDKSKGRYRTVVVFARRLSAITVNIIVILVAKRYISISDVAEIGATSFPLSLFGKAFLLLWYVFLSQFSIWWFLWLPIYLLVFPLYWVTVKLFSFFGQPLWARVKQLQKIGEGGGTLPKAAKTKNRFAFRKIWIASFLVWLLVFRGLEFSWAQWIPSILLLPIWIKALIYAAKIATNPSTFSGRVISLANRGINGIVTSLTDSQKEKKVETKKSNNVIFGLVHLVIGRYSGDQLLSRLHREAILTFSITLLFSVSASAVFWALMGRAMNINSPGYLNAYNFFSSGSLSETILWSLGCMFTAIGFPGSNAPITIKALHAAILGTGIFQFSFLLACFSIMASADVGRIVEHTKSAVENLSKKLEATKKLQHAILSQQEKPENKSDSSSP